MTKSSLLFLLLPLTAMAQEEKDFTITGSLKNISPTVAKVYVTYTSNGERKLDSAEVKNNLYVVKGKLANPSLASLYVTYLDGLKSSPKRDNYALFLEPASFKVQSSDSFSNATVSGSKAHADYLALTGAVRKYDSTLNRLYEQWYKLSKEKEQQQVVEAQIDSIETLVKENVYKAFVTKKPASPVALYALSQYGGFDINADQVEPLFTLLPKTTQEWPASKEYKERIEIAKKTGVGKMAMEFTQADTLGNPVSLSSFRGKYVLVDFWASWCGPCRRENPNVVKNFNLYKDKGFTVLGVSLERPNAKEKWLKAIHDDNLTWTHVSDFQFFDNAVAKQYGIRAIPQNLLLDPQGKIIARNLRGEALEKKLAELFRNATAAK